MSDNNIKSTPIDLNDWIEEISADRAKHQQRQITVIILNAVALVEAFRGCLVLKGGMLLAIAHGSQRQTSDLDFSARADPEAFAARFVEEMNRGLDRARAQLGYAQWRCRVQGKIKLQPRGFATANFPAIAARISYARAGSIDEKHLLTDQCTNVIDIEISFHEPIIETEELRLLAGNAEIEVYSVNEVIAEKFRAFLQQGIRNRRRRQDIYDIAFLVDQHGNDGIDRSLILHALREKCAARDVPLDPTRIDDTDLIARARSEWHTMEFELGELPPFEDCYASARALFLSLPWNT
jgi:hypothetical protein